MIRPTTPADTDALVPLADATGVFKPHEIVALREVLDDYHAANRDEGHVAFTSEDGGRALGFVYYAPVAMTDNTWEVWWIAVAASEQRRGLGKQLLDFAEADVRDRGGRLLLIDTSSLPNYEPTRQFYLRRGYAISAQIPDFYRDGDDKVVFWKKLSDRSI
jgi:ribosomal protein S18 acetylase RimI-like enzyme